MEKDVRTKTAPRILSFLARNKPASKWELAKTLKKSYGNTHATIQQLLNRNLIKVGYIKPSAKNPKIEVEYYELTFFGLVVILSMFDKEIWKYIDEIADTQNDKLPLIFGKWAFFERRGVKDVVIKRLKDKMSEFSTHPAKRQELETLRVIEQIKQKEPEKDILEYRDLFEAMYKDKAKADPVMKEWAETLREFDETFIAIESKHTKPDIINSVFGLRPPFLPAKELIEFMSVLKEDSELREYIRNEIARIQDNRVKELENIRSFKFWWNQ